MHLQATLDTFNRTSSSEILFEVPELPSGRYTVTLRKVGLVPLLIASLPHAQSGTRLST